MRVLRFLGYFLGAIAIGVGAGLTATTLRDEFMPGYSTIEKNLGFTPLDLPAPSDDALTVNAPKTTSVAKTITLEKSDTVVFRGPVTESSVATAIQRLRDISDSMPASGTIYLVLDTPGGSIMDGLDLIDFAAALPQKVHTVTLFAASMGFQIAQNLNTRYIIRNGTLMSHRASVSGLSGQVKGELETRYKMIRRAVDFMDSIAAGRMGLTVKQYDDLIVHEYWVYGYDAVPAKVADEQVLVKCGRSLKGTDEVDFNTMFGKVTVTFSKCPLVKMPLKIDFSKIQPGDRGTAGEVFTTAFTKKPTFVKDYILTDKFNQIFH